MATCVLLLSAGAASAVNATGLSEYAFICQFPEDFTPDAQSPMPLRAKDWETGRNAKPEAYYETCEEVANELFTNYANMNEANMCKGCDNDENCWETVECEAEDGTPLKEKCRLFSVGSAGNTQSPIYVIDYLTGGRNEKGTRVYELDRLCNGIPCNENPRNGDCCGGKERSLDICKERSTHPCSRGRALMGEERNQPSGNSPICDAQCRSDCKNAISGGSALSPALAGLAAALAAVAVA